MHERTAWGDEYIKRDQERNTLAHRVVREDEEYRKTEQETKKMAQRIATEDEEYRKTESC
jgi:hypothetical protein